MPFRGVGVESRCRKTVLHVFCGCSGDVGAFVGSLGWLEDDLVMDIMLIIISALLPNEGIHNSETSAQVDM